jgi:hypothetical protein
MQLCVCPRYQPFVWYLVVGADVNTLCPKVRTRFFDLRHQFCVCLWHVVEGEDSPAELKEEVCAERDEGPEGNL